MAPGELDVEVRDQSVDVVVPLHLQAERGGEGQVFCLHRVDVHLLKKDTNKVRLHVSVTSPQSAEQTAA